MKIPCHIENLIRYIVPKFRLRHNGNLRIARDCFFDSAENVKFGRDVFVNRKCQFHIGVSNANIFVGNSVWVGPDVCFICPTHEIGTETQRAGKGIYKDIIIGDGCWIGARCTILPGVTIEKRSIIAAGSLVNKSLRSNCLWGAVRLIKEL